MASASPPSRPLLVLVVDDNETNRLILSRAVEAFGAHVRTAENGLEALDKLREEPFNLVFMAIAMPVLPYSPNEASAELPGTIGLTGELLGAILERLSEQAITSGFKNIILMGDHGGGQPKIYAEVARKLDEKYAPNGIHVYYSDEVYKKAQDDFNSWLLAHGYPRSAHAGIPDTSEMLYLGGDKGWVRKELIKDAVGDPLSEPGQTGADALPHKSNGINGDARRSTPGLGKMAFDMKVHYAVKQIQGFL